MKKISCSISGFSLVEVTLAIGVVSFCALSMVGLLSVGLHSDSTSSSETAVTNILTSIVSDISVTPQSSSATAPISPQFNIPVPATGSPQSYAFYFKEDGTLSATAGGSAVAANAPVYRATVTVIPPSSTKGATVVRVLMTWPALADPTANIGPSKQKGSVETVTALLRN